MWIVIDKCARKRTCQVCKYPIPKDNYCLLVLRNGRGGSICNECLKIFNTACSLRNEKLQPSQMVNN